MGFMNFAVVVFFLKYSFLREVGSDPNLFAMFLLELELN